MVCVCGQALNLASRRVDEDGGGVGCWGFGVRIGRKQATARTSIRRGVVTRGCPAARALSPTARTKSSKATQADQQQERDEGVGCWSNSKDQSSDPQVTLPMPELFQPRV